MSDRSAADLARFVADVEKAMREAVLTEGAASPALDLLAAGGKRLRTRLLWLASRFGRRADDARAPLLPAAVALELAHLGSLVHDDVVDGTATRRGAPTLHRTFGERVAIQVGTALLHKASALVAPLAQPLRRAVAGAITACCRGQVRELLHLFKMPTLEERLSIMLGKTSALFDLAVQLGATLGNASSADLHALRQFARRFGVAFQITDDVLDLVGKPTLLGRANGTDLLDGVLTMPMLLAAEGDPKLHHDIQALRSAPSDEGVDHCIARIRRTDGIARAQAMAAAWLRSAQETLATTSLPHPRHALRILAEDAVDTGQQPDPWVDTSLKDRAEPRWIALRFLPGSRRDPIAVIRARLAAIDPRLSLIDIQGVGTRTDLVIDHLAGADLSPAHLALRSITLGDNALVDRGCESMGLHPLALADCLHAIGLEFLADTDSSTHLTVETHILRGMSHDPAPPPSSALPIQATGTDDQRPSLP